MRAPPPRPPIRALVAPPRARARLAAAVAALAALAMPARLAAQLPVAPGSWTVFEWFLGVGPVEGDGFLLDAAQRTRVRVTDVGATGDAFDILVNGALLGATPAVPGGTFTGIFDGDAAWAEPALSKGELFLDPGQYRITLAVRATAPGVAFGEGLLRADAAPLVGVVPEPAPLASAAGGAALLALVTARRRRARRAEG